MNYTTVLCNSFSINMLNTALIEEVGGKTITFRPITPLKAAELVQNGLKSESFKNAVGHSTSDGLIRGQLEEVLPKIEGMIPKGKRETVKLSGGELVIVGQYIGPRLNEGAIALPENSQIKYWLIIL
jgi:hypothetical protein